MGYAKGGDIGEASYARGGKARGGDTRFTKKTVSEKHLQDMKEAPNQFTDDEPDLAPVKGRRAEQEQQDYGKGK